MPRLADTLSRIAVLVFLLALLGLAIASVLGTVTADPQPSVGPAPSAAPVDSVADPRVRIAAVYPNPAADGDRGEFVLLSVPRRTNLSGWMLDDGEGVVALHGTVGGRVAVTEDPAAVRTLTNDTLAVDRVLGVDAMPALSNGGERLVLRHENETVDRLRYSDAPERSLYGGEWRHLDATNRSVTRYGARSVRAFVLPDAPDAAVDFLRGADRRILLAGYTLESRRVADALARAARRGVRVRVLVDAGPVGGVSRRQVRLLDRLAAAGVDVRVYGGEGAPYAYHHAKYAVVDDRALVTTENWEPGSLGGHGNRGWGAVVSGDDLADDLAGVVRADAAPPAAVRWMTYRETVDPVYGSPARASYPSRLDPERVRAESVRLLLAPDNAEGALVDLLAGAERSVRIQQVSMEPGPLLSETIDAARRGVSVRILLSGAEYTRQENRRLAEALNRRAEREGWDLQVRVADPGGRYGAIHTKGAIVDDSVVLGSLNWNDHSAQRNREVVLVLRGEGVADYYGRAFDADWGGGSNGPPTWLVLAGLAALVLAAAVGYRRVRFGSGPEEPTEAWQRP